MADQEFLASFGVEIDETGATRLQDILTENTELAQSLSDAFNNATAAIQAFVQELSQSLPGLFGGNGYGNVTENALGSGGTIQLRLDVSQAEKDLKAFTDKLKKPVELSADASKIITAGNTALNTLKALYSTPLTLTVNIQYNDPGYTPGNPDGNPGGNETPGVPHPGNTGGNPGGNQDLPMSTGGRFARPTSVQVAEDGDAEYIIPVRKESKAVPLLRQLLGELSQSARDAVLGGADEPLEAGNVILNDTKQQSEEQSVSIVKQTLPSHELSAQPALSGLESVLSSLASLFPAAGNVQNTQNVSAPVSINVNAASGTGEEIGETVYRTAERYLLKTLRSL